MVNKNIFSFIDLTTFDVLFYSINKFGYLEYEKSINLKKGMPYTPVVINDTSIVSLFFQLNSGKYAEYDSTGLLKRTLGEISPGKKEKVSLFAHNQASKGLMKMTPDGTKLIISYQFADLIEIYKINGTLIRRIEGPQKLLPQYSIHEVNGYQNVILDNSKSILGYIDVEVTNSHILALYSGELTDTAHEGEYLHVFSMNGELVKSYRLKSKISEITFDRVNNKIFGTHLGSSSKIFRFEEDFEFANL